MIAVVRRLRARGWRTGLLSNSLGDDCYAGFDLPSMFDTVTLSRDIAARKPSRLAYRIAGERLGAAPEQAVMVDDLEQNVAAARRLGMAGVIHRDAAATSAALAGLLGRANRT
jgi:putative hydrolase of the HAD superfamily